MSASSLNDMLADALASLMLSAVRLNASGMAKITLCGLDVALEHLEDRDLLVLYCSVGRLPAEVSPDVYEFLLEANLFGVGLAGGIWVCIALRVPCSFPFPCTKTTFPRPASTAPSNASPSRPPVSSTP